MSQQDIHARVKSLSPEKQELLALKLGMTSQVKSDNKTTLAAFVKANEANESALRQHLKQRLPDYMIPAQIRVLDDIPRTPNGKVDRHQLLNSLKSTPVTQPASSPAEEIDDVEARLIEIWKDLLGIDMITPDDDFFELGGYSLLAIRMFAAINGAFDTDLQLSILMEAPTIAQLAEKVRSKEDFTDILLPIRETGDKAPLYIFQVNRFGVIHYNQLLKMMDINRPIYGVTQADFDDDKERSFVELADYFANAILANQPEGPYYFLGLSVAGLVAYEVARNLENRGIKNVHVIMFDTYGPDYPEKIPIATAIRQKLNVFIEQLIQGDIDKKQFLLRDMLWQLQYRGAFRLRKYSNRLRRRLGLPVKVRDEDNLNLGGEAIFKHYFAYFAEQHKSTVPILLYRSQLQPLSANHSPMLHWERYVPPEHIEVKQVIGAHTSLLKDSVQPIAEHLQNWLSDKD